MSIIGGNIANKYAELVKEIWLGTSDHIVPWGLKKAIGQFAYQVN